MSRVHLDVKFPFDNTQTMVIRFDKKSTRNDIINQLEEKIHDPKYKNAKMILRKDKNIKIWIKKNDTLQSLGVESDMTLLVFQNPIRIQFEHNSTNHETSFSPTETILEIIGRFAESSSIIYYLGYSVTPIKKGRSIPITEDLSLCEQIHKFDKILFRIKYYPILPNDTESGVPLGRTYVLTRDFLLTGFSPLSRKDYISLCAKIAVIESGDIIDSRLLAFDSAYFVRYLPQNLKKDLNAEDDLFDQIQTIERQETNQMKLNFVNSARSLKFFGYQSFNVEYSILSNEPTYINFCVGYSDILLAEKSDGSIIERLDLDDINFEMNIQGANKFLLNDKYFISATSDQISEIINLTKGYKHLKSKLSRVQTLDSKLESVVYNYHIDNDVNFILNIPSCFLRDATPSIEFFFALQTFEKCSTPFNDETIKAIGNLYYTSSEKIPQFDDLNISEDLGLNLNEMGDSLLDMLGIVSMEIRSGSTSLVDLAQKYGNDLRSTVFIAHMMRQKPDIDQKLCDEIILSYKMISMNLRAEIILAKMKGLYISFSFPSIAYEKLVELSQSILISIKEEKNSDSPEKYVELYNRIEAIITELSTRYQNLLEAKDPLKAFETTDDISSLIDQISYFTSVFSLINQNISNNLSAVLQYLDSLKIIQIIFQKQPAEVSDLAFDLETILRESDLFIQGIDDVQMKTRVVFIFDVISSLQNEIPKYTDEFIQKSHYDKLTELLIRYYNDLILLGYDKGNGNEISYNSLCYSILIALWTLRMIPQESIYEETQPDKSQLEKKNSQRIKYPRIRLPKQLSAEDEIEVSTEQCNKLVLCLSDTTDNSINLQNFMNEIHSMDPKMSSILQVLLKWKPLIEKANRSQNSFDKVRKNYEFGLRILRANAERQSRFQPPQILLMKIMNHFNFVKSKKIDPYKEIFNSIGDKNHEIEILNKLPQFRQLLTELESVNNPNVFVQSLMHVLKKLINYLTLFTDEHFSLGQVMHSMVIALKKGKEILMKLISSQYDENLNKIILDLYAQLKKLQDIGNYIMKKTLNKKKMDNLIKKVQKVRKNMSGLAVLLVDKLLKEDSDDLFIMMNICFWRICHIHPEPNHHTRIDTLLTECSKSFRSLAGTLQDKMLGVNSIPQYLITLLLSKAKQVTKVNDPKVLDSYIDDMDELIKKQRFWQISPQVEILITTIELTIGRMQQRPFVHIFSELNPTQPSFTLPIEDTSKEETRNTTDDNGDSSSTPPTNGTANETGESDASIEPGGFKSFASDSSSDSSNEVVHHSIRNKNITRFRTMSNMDFSNFEGHNIRGSRSDSSLTKPQRPGILLDPAVAAARSIVSPHVSFDLGTDQNTQIFSSSKSRVIDEAIPQEIIPLIMINKPNFISWNLPKYIAKTITLDKMPSINPKLSSPDILTKQPLKRVESFSQLTFDMLRLRPFNDNYSIFTYPTKEKAEEEIDISYVQCQTCETRFSKMVNNPFAERIFFIIDWFTPLSAIPTKVAAAMKYNLEQIPKIKSLYETIKEKFDSLIDELKYEEFFTVTQGIELLLKLLKLTRFALQKAETDLLEIDYQAKDIATSWLIYTDEVIELFQEMIEIDEPLVAAFSKQMIDSVFSSFIKFGQFAEIIDGATKRQIMLLLQCQLCLQLRCVLSNIKRMDLMERASKVHISNYVKNLIEDVKTIPMYSNFCLLLNEILKSLSKEFIFADADWYSLQLRIVMEDQIISETKRVYSNDPDSILVSICYRTFSLRYNLISMDFAPLPEVKSTFILLSEEIIQDIDDLILKMNSNSSTVDSVFCKNVVEKWTSFFSLFVKELRELDSVSILMLNSPDRLKTALKYLKKVAAEIVRMEEPKFPINVTSSYNQFADHYVQLIDYILDKLNVDQFKKAKPKDLPISYDNVSKLPSVKVTKFVNSYKSYYNKLEDYKKKTKLNLKVDLLLSLLLSHLRSFSRKFNTSYMSIYDTIDVISKSMIDIIPCLKNKEEEFDFNQIFESHHKTLELLRIKDDSAISTAEISIMQELIQIGELVVDLIIYNLDFFLTKTSNSKALNKLFKHFKFKDYSKAIQDDLTFSGDLGIINLQLALYQQIHTKLNEILSQENPFGFTHDELEIINNLEISPESQTAYLPSAIKAHNYISSKFESLFIFTDSQKFLNGLQKFCQNASIYFGYYLPLPHIALSEIANRVVVEVNKILKGITNLATFRQSYFFVMSLMNSLKVRLDDLVNIEKEESKSSKVDKVLVQLNETSKILSQNKSKNIFGLLNDFILNIQKLSRLKLRVSLDFNVLISFFFIVKNLLETDDTSIQILNIQIILKMFLKTDLPITETFSEQIANYLDNCINK